MERLLYRPRENPATRVLVLCPTRELAMQCHSVASKLASFTDLAFCLCVGGLSLKTQEAELKLHPDVVIATPGRLIDHLRNSMAFTLDELEILIMDEADRMLEDGFRDELAEIIKSCPKKRQTENVDELIKLSMNKPVRIQIADVKATADKLVQEFVRIREHREQDRSAFLLALCTRAYTKRCIIFLKNKVTAKQLKIVFGLMGLSAGELHGNLSQEQRMESLEKFRDGKVDFLLATDLAARGLDIKGVETVINYHMPTTYSQYLHRIGRTARAGSAGKSASLVGESDRKVLKQAIKNAAPNTVLHRVIPLQVIAEYKKRVDGLEANVRDIMQEEKEDRMMKRAEMEVKKASNLMEHAAEIASRPARTWFQTAKEKKAAKEKPVPVVEKEKRKLPKTAGMSRAKKRRFMDRQEEDQKWKGESIQAAKAAKRQALPKKMGQFKSDLTDRSKYAAGPKLARQRQEKRVGGKGTAMAKIKNKQRNKRKG
jgi:ATP-dependent RNA helicase DDX27